MKKNVFYFIMLISILSCKNLSINKEEKKEKEIPIKTIKTKNQKNTKKNKFKLYIIKKGDTLWGISKKIYKNPYLWPKIWKKNKIKNPNKIYPNSKIRIITNLKRRYK